MKDPEDWGAFSAGFQAGVDHAKKQFDSATQMLMGRPMDLGPFDPDSPEKQVAAMMAFSKMSEVTSED